MKSAFSFVEVIISVVILSYLGMAILNFNSFNKKAMGNNISKQSTLLVSTPILNKVDDFENNKAYSLYELVKFKKLTKDDSDFLKSIKISGYKRVQDKSFIYNDGKKDYYLQYSNFGIKYKDSNILNFISIQSDG